MSIRAELGSRVGRQPEALIRADKRVIGQATERTLIGGTGIGRERGEAPMPEGRGLHNVASLKCIHRHALGQSTDADISCRFPFQEIAPDSEEVVRRLAVSRKPFETAVPNR